MEYMFKNGQREFAISDKKFAELFIVYIIKSKSGRYILKPNEHEGLVFYANDKTLRKIQRKGWPYLLQSKIRHAILCPHNDLFIKAAPSVVAPEILALACLRLYQITEDKNRIIKE